MAYYHNSDRLRFSCGVTTGISSNKCSYNSILISTSPSSGGISIVTEAAPQASDAVGKAKEGVSGHSIVAGAGTEESTGGCIIITVIACDCVAVLPQASVAINVLTTVYSLAQAPECVASVLVTEAAPQASDAVGVANEGVSGHSIVVGAGTEESTGAVLS